eukprot:COSAG06_NODE_556_length_14336_cov_8.683290_9_plen_38_part_00
MRRGDCTGMDSTPTVSPPLPPCHKVRHGGLSSLSSFP